MEGGEIINDQASVDQPPVASDEEVKQYVDPFGRPVKLIKRSDKLFVTHQRQGGLIEVEVTEETSEEVFANECASTTWM